jgi:DNA replication protein
MSYNELTRWIESGQTLVPNLLLQNYKKIGLADTEFIFVLQLKAYIDKNVPFPNLALIAENMGIAEKDVFSLLHNLLQKQMLLMETKNDLSGKVEDSYSLDPLYQRLFQLMERSEKKQPVQKQEKNIMSMFEQEFGRNLSPIEMQTIASWIDMDHYPLELIESALKEAVLNRVYSLKYIDRILLAWEKKNIKSVKDLIQQQTTRPPSKPDKFEGSPETEPAMEVPLYNWLDTDPDA